ncbi:MAG: M1 family aminopeptidase [Bacteroidetes bacterium]|nr:M1 family aminopeptidase [Bacteroidota bacterium]
MTGEQFPLSVSLKRFRFLIAGIGIFILAGSYAQKPFTAHVPAGNSADTVHFYMKHAYDVQKYELNLDIYDNYKTPYSWAFHASEVITVRVDSALNFIRLNAVNTSLQIDSVGNPGISFTHANDTLVIQLDRTYQPGETVQVRIWYQHKNIKDNAFYTNGGFVFTDTPPEGSRKWFPCWDRPADKALLDLTAKVPLNVKLGSNGGLADSLITGDTIYYHWISRDPISTYLITIASKIDYSLDIVYRHKPGNPADSIPARFYYQSWQVPDSIEARIGEMTDYFSSLFGEYPFEKIGFATLNGSFPWGGMENQTMINLTANGWQEGLVSHEFSHMWFGDLITCGTWADIWLNESFATYCESLWLEHRSGYSSYKNHLNQQADYYLANNPKIPIYNPSWAIHTPNSNFLYNSALEYDKGACVLHQLRYVLGDSLFFMVMKAYATDTGFMYKNAVTEDFIALTNAVSGRDMSWFFDEWLYHPDHPAYSSFYDVQDIGSGRWNLELLISQTQTTTGFFKMPLQVKVLFGDSTDTLIQVINDTDHQFFEFTFLKQPVGIVFDPNRNILLKTAITNLGIDQKQAEIGFRLFQNEPNPFRNTTTVTYRLPVASSVRITVMDANGKEVLAPFTSSDAAGTHSFQISAKDLAPGVYFCKMEAGKFNEVRKMVLVK